jgi:hypothetical protein
MSVAEIHRELYAAVYVGNVTTEETVKHWCKMFKDGRNMSTMKSEVFGHL